MHVVIIGMIVTYCYTLLVYTIHSGGDSDTMETDNTEQQAGRQLEPQNSEQSKPSSVFKP